jgi:hypothetical protein
MSCCVRQKLLTRLINSIPSEIPDGLITSPRCTLIGIFEGRPFQGPPALISASVMPSARSVGVSALLALAARRGLPREMLQNAQRAERQSRVSLFPNRGSLSTFRISGGVRLCIPGMAVRTIQSV